MPAEDYKINQDRDAVIRLLHKLGDGCEKHFNIVSNPHDGALSVAFKLGKLKSENHALAEQAAEAFGLPWRGFQKTLDAILDAANKNCVHPREVQKISDFRWFTQICDQVCQERHIYGSDLMARWRRLNVAREQGNKATRPFFKYG